MHPEHITFCKNPHPDNQLDLIKNESSKLHDRHCINQTLFSNLMLFEEQCRGSYF